ncbi:hypothetical protein DM02DRAFT_543158, partial [Periconia macrospinosa]
DVPRYNPGPADTMNDAVNVVFLGAYFHIAFDQSRFTFVLEPICNGSGMRPFFRSLGPSAEYEHFYHDRKLYSSVIGIVILYVRFA